MKMFKELAITLLFSAGSLCAMDLQKKLLIRKRDAIQQERLRVQDTDMSDAGSAARKGKARSLQRLHEQIGLVDRELAALDKKTAEHHKEIAEYNRQIALVEAEQCKVRNMGYNDPSLATILSSLKTQRDEAVLTFGKSPNEVQKMTLEKEKLARLEGIKSLEEERLQHLEAIKILCEENPYPSRSRSEKFVTQEQKDSHIKRLAAINAQLLGIEKK